MYQLFFYTIDPFHALQLSDFSFRLVVLEVKHLDYCVLLLTHLYVSFVGPLMPIHALYARPAALPHVDAEQGSSPHGVLNTGVMRG